MSVKIKQIIAIIVATALGLGVAYLAGQNGAASGKYSVFFLCGLLAYAINWLAFIPASLAQTEKYYDITGSFTYISVMLLAAYLASPLDLRGKIVFAMVIIWAMRLGSFLYTRVHKDGGDRRFDKIKNAPVRFFLTWTLQGAWVILTAACALAIITTSNSKPLGIFFFLGAALWLFGFVFEVIADRQKSTFRSKPENKGRFITTGLWAKSRHPNYFGEIALWVGIAIIALPVLSGASFAALISPFFVIFLLGFVSGVPMLEKSADSRWGDDKDYVAYRDTTPVLVPKLFGQ